MFFGTTEAAVEMEDAANKAPAFLDADRNTPGKQDEVEGSDDFSVNGTTLATTFTAADFEDTPSYSITIVAISTRGTGDDEVKMYATLAVTVEVVDRGRRWYGELHAEGASGW